MVKQEYHLSIWAPPRGTSEKNHGRFFLMSESKKIAEISISRNYNPIFMYGSLEYLFVNRSLDFIITYVHSIMTCFA